jgi:hypothetical protein
MRSERGKTALRCAIYTRVSTEHGLEQKFNALDNQREASEAYVKSQAHEGWKLIRTGYDDGGYSGGLMDRPALNRLLHDVRGRRVNVDRCLQGRPADPVARRLRQASRTVRRPSSVVRLAHPGVQHRHQHGTIDPERPLNPSPSSSARSLASGSGTRSPPRLSIARSASGACAAIDRKITPSQQLNWEEAE